jgi:hypothetical protein
MMMSTLLCAHIRFFMQAITILVLTDIVREFPEYKDKEWKN